MADENVKADELTDKKEVDTPKGPSPFKVYSMEGTLMYTSNEEEFDECFYNILSLGVWTKTFEIGKRLKLTFTTIDAETKMQLLKEVKTWGDAEKATTQMFDQFMTKTNLSRYLTTIELNDTMINLRQGDLAKKLELLGGMADQALALYGNWLYVFQEIIRRSLTSQVATKNS